MKTLLQAFLFPIDFGVLFSPSMSGWGGGGGNGKKFVWPVSRKL